MRKPLGPLLRKTVPRKGTAPTQRSLPSVSENSLQLILGVLVQSSKHALSAYCALGILWDVGDMAGISPPGLGPQGASGLMGR